VHRKTRSPKNDGALNPNAVYRSVMSMMSRPSRIARFARTGADNIVAKI
jgi:hypothetical protein